MRIEKSVTVAAPREQVWEAISDPPKANAFLVGLSFDTVEGEPSSGPRARYSVRARAGSAAVGGTVEVIEWEPPHLLAWTSITGIDQRGRWILRERGRQTHVTLRLSYEVPGGVLALIADRIGSRAVRRNVRASLSALKRMLEVR